MSTPLPCVAACSCRVPTNGQQPPTATGMQVQGLPAATAHRTAAPRLAKAGAPTGIWTYYLAAVRTNTRPPGGCLYRLAGLWLAYGKQAITLITA